jgi:hypothetical protein
MPTDKQYDEVIRSCKEIFLRKAMDYGTAWRVARSPSLIDILKHNHCHPETGKQKVADDISQNSKALLIRHNRPFAIRLNRG